ncbi:MAG: DUF4386 family protein [Candidatus Bathyarchaeota archaeon]|nr:DUF4386 family protein [Candidatus Bathyarchaeota archaeon]
MTVDPSWKGVYRVGGLSLFAAGFVVFLFFLALLILQTSPTLTPEMVLDNPVPPASLYVLAAFGELLLMPGVLGLYCSLKNVKKTHMLVATALWLVAVISFLISRSQIIALLPISGSYQATTSETMRAAYLVSAEHAIELGNVFAEMALMFLAVSSVIIGLVMRKGVFSKGISSLVTIAGILTLLGTMGILLEPLTILTVFGLVLSAVWQIAVGIKLYKLG